MASGSHPEDGNPAHEETSRAESEIEEAEVLTPENREVPDEIDDNDLPPLPMALWPAPAEAQMPISLASLFVPPGHHIVHGPPRSTNLVQRMYSDWQKYFDNFHN